MAPGEVPTATKLMQSAAASTTYAVAGGWQSWGKREKWAVLATTVLVAVGIMAAVGGAILINRKMRILNQKNKGKNPIRKGGNRGKGTKGKKEKSIGEPRGIELMEIVSNEPTALASNHRDSMAVQGTSSLAAEPLMMSGALQENRQVRKGKRPFLPMILGRTSTKEF